MASPTFQEHMDRLRIRLDLGTELEVFLLQCPNEATCAALRAQLRDHAARTGRAFIEPPPYPRTLPWLQEQREARSGLFAQGSGAPPLVFIALPDDEEYERELLFRLNEQRDNLRAEAWGALCLAGTGDFLRRVAHNAPDLWSGRSWSMDLPADEEATRSWPAAAPQKAGPAPVRVFVVYSGRDMPYMAELERHLHLLARRGILKLEGIDPGSTTGPHGIDRAAEEADLIVMLLSPDSLARRIFETRYLLQRARQRAVRLVSVLLKPVDLVGTPFLGPGLLLWGRPVLDFGDRDFAWAEVAREIRRLALDIQSQRA